MAGRGSRFEDTAEHVPKPLIEVQPGRELVLTEAMTRGPAAAALLATPLLAPDDELLVAYCARFPLDSFSRLREITILDGLRVLIPDPPEAVLETIYGPNWHIPDPGYSSTNDLANRLSIPKGQPIPRPL